MLKKIIAFAVIIAACDANGMRILLSRLKGAKPVVSRLAAATARVAQKSRARCFAAATKNEQIPPNLPKTIFPRYWPKTDVVNNRIYDSYESLGHLDTFTEALANPPFDLAKVDKAIDTVPDALQKNLLSYVLRLATLRESQEDSYAKVIGLLLNGRSLAWWCKQDEPVWNGNKMWRSLRGDTPLHLAVYFDLPKMTEQLLKKGCKVNPQNDYGRTPLHYVQSAAIARMLLDRKADVRLKDKGGNLPLHKSASRNSDEAFSLILKHDTDAIEQYNGEYYPIKGSMLCDQSRFSRFMEWEEIEAMDKEFKEQDQTIKRDQPDERGRYFEWSYDGVTPLMLVARDKVKLKAILEVAPRAAILKQMKSLYVLANEETRAMLKEFQNKDNK